MNEQEREAVVKGMSKKDLITLVEKLEKNLSLEREKSETYMRQLKYARADVENLRKTSEKQVENAIRSGNERLVGELLVILDDLELALRAVEKPSEDRSLVSGMRMVLVKFEKILWDAGLKPIEAFGKPFDPSLHEVVTRVETCDERDGIVLEEIRRGYTFGGKVIRASMVKVSVKPKNMEDKREGEVHG